MRRHRPLFGCVGLFLFLWCGIIFQTLAAPSSTIVVGSKKDVEGRVLGEVIAQLLEIRGFTVERRLGLGGTLLCFEALKSGEIDVYPEYTGTVEQAILKLDAHASWTDLAARLRATLDMQLLEPFGFNNTYAIAVSRQLVAKHHLQSIGDVARVPGLRFGFSHEFLNRTDGWPGLAQMYQLSAEPVGIEHGLAYQAVHDGKIDVTDAYSTDGELRTMELVLLQDDRNYFPEYLAAPLVKTSFSAEATQALALLAGAIDAEAMQRLNAQAQSSGGDFASLARDFLRAQGVVTHSSPPVSHRWANLVRRTGVHLQLTFLALVAALVVALPLGIAIYRLGAVSRPVLYVLGVLQTIPSIALLALMIPVFGVGVIPAVVALFLYALLPIVRNTTAALLSVDPLLKEISLGLGMTTWERLRHVEIPLALPLILAGVRTAAVIGIGTATLAAFIGAGGLGEPIVTGLALNDPLLILEGAVPAALLAIVTELGFESLERWWIPSHLKAQ